MKRTSHVFLSLSLFHSHLGWNFTYYEDEIRRFREMIGLSLSVSLLLSLSRSTLEIDEAR